MFFKIVFGSTTSSFINLTNVFSALLRGGFLVALPYKFFTLLYANLPTPGTAFNPPYTAGAATAPIAVFIIVFCPSDLPAP